MNDVRDFYGPNAGYVEELYERFRQDPASVDAGTRAVFENGFEPEAVFGSPAPAAAPIHASSAAAPTLDVATIVAGARLGRIVRELGHLDAQLDPLGSPPPSDPALQLEAHGLTEARLHELPASVIGGPLASGETDAFSALAKLRKAYSGFVGYEDDHIQIAEERDWLRSAVETGRFFENFGPEEKRDVLRQLTEVDGFEQFLQTVQPYQGQKRFSIEGCDVMVPMLDAIIRCTARTGTREVVIGMAHRGRLNVLAHVLNKPYEAILSEFPNPNAPQMQQAVSGASALGYTGDVKYHKGYQRAFFGSEGAAEMPITLAPNPSHLEFVNPAVVGRARAAQETRDHAGPPVQDVKASLAIVVHGDAAFPGQGIVAETLNMGQLPGYRVGGTIHIIANNQIGFTTNPRDGRSTLYASDLAKGFEIPIVHVNADEPAACMAVARMACAYRERFNKDFLIDLIGYRRLGHNETEEPAFTQPQMYEAIRKHKRARELWADRLIAEGIVTTEEANALVQAVRDRLMAAKNTPTPTDRPQNYPDAAPDRMGDTDPQTRVEADKLRALNAGLLAVPSGFAPDPKIAKNFLIPRQTALDTGTVIWAHGESLALAAILSDGTPIRMTGQDTERGTFTQRHLVLHDPNTGARFCPLQNLPEAQASFALFNSPLSENAAIGFEYGYSVHAKKTLVLWEAQFGDFANGAQVIIDQFIISGNAKWGQSPSLVLLLPHGYEGQGPEHSSARLERFLQLCAGDNLRVVNCTTPAQYFHVLRRQAALLKVEPRPLVIMTPKSLLRHPRVTSGLADFTEGRFRPVLDDTRDAARKAGVTRVVLCSGKIYVDMTTGPGPQYAPRPEYEQNDRVGVARLEELNPFPEGDLRDLLAGYPALREVIWTQEEPRNMGAWSFVAPRLAELLPSGVKLRYVGRPESASPAEGSDAMHRAAQTRIIAESFADAPDALPVVRVKAATKNGKNGNGAGHAPAPAESLSAENSEMTQRTDSPHAR